MRRLALILATLALCACGPRWDLRSAEDGWTTYRLGRSAKRPPAKGGLFMTYDYREQGTAWVVDPQTVSIRTSHRIRPFEQVLVFDHGHWRWCSLKGTLSKGRYLVGAESMHLELPGGDSWR